MTSDQQAELEQYRKAAREYHESVERRLKELEDTANPFSYIDLTRRVARLEETEKDRAIAQPVLTSSSRCIVTEAHIEKLERIREAAQVVAKYDWGANDGFPDRIMTMVKLREALRS